MRYLAFLFWMSGGTLTMIIMDAPTVQIVSYSAGFLVGCFLTNQMYGRK